MENFSKRNDADSQWHPNIEATQIGTIESAQLVVDDIDGTSIINDVPEGFHVLVPMSTNGKLNANVGDWIVKHSSGRVEVLTDSEFTEAYQGK